MIEEELRFLSFWNFYGEYDSCNGLWNVFNREGIKVGFVSVEEEDRFFVVQMKVMSDKIRVDDVRFVDKDKKKSEKRKNQYHFSVWKDNKWYKASILWGNVIEVRINNEEERVHFLVGDGNLEFDVEEDTLNFHIKEHVLLKKNAAFLKNKESWNYDYQLTYRRRDKKSKAGDVMLGFNVTDYHQDEGSIKILETMKRVNTGKYLTTIAKADVFEAIFKHELGISSFARLRFLANYYLDFGEEVFWTFLKGGEINLEGMDLFLGDIMTQRIKEREIYELRRSS